MYGVTLTLLLAVAPSAPPPLVEWSADLRPPSVAAEALVALEQVFDQLAPPEEGGFTKAQLAAHRELLEGVVSARVLHAADMVLPDDDSTHQRYQRWESKRAFVRRYLDLEARSELMGWAFECGVMTCSAPGSHMETQLAFWPRPGDERWVLAGVREGDAMVVDTRAYEVHETYLAWLDTIRDEARKKARRPNRAGLKLHQAGRPGPAIAHYEAALAIDPGYVWARYNRACAYALTDRTDEALEDLAKLRAHPGPEALARLVRSLGDPDLARLDGDPRLRELQKEARAAGPTDPEHFTAWLQAMRAAPGRVVQARGLRQTRCGERCEVASAVAEGTSTEALLHHIVVWTAVLVPELYAWNPRVLVLRGDGVGFLLVRDPTPDGWRVSGWVELDDEEVELTMSHDDPVIAGALAALGGA